MLIDSNILIYALNIKSDKHKAARHFLKQNYKNLYIAQQNVLETLRVITHSKFPNVLLPIKAVDKIEKLAVGFNLITPKAETYLIALDLISKYKISGNRIFDAYLVATMLSNGITRIATDNVKDFAIYRGIEVVNPFKE